MVLLSHSRSAMPAPAVIADLVKRFEEQGDAYKSGGYHEAQLLPDSLIRCSRRLAGTCITDRATPNHIKTSFTKTRLRSAVQQKRLTTVFGSAARPNFFSKPRSLQSTSSTTPLPPITFSVTPARRIAAERLTVFEDSLLTTGVLAASEL